MGTSSIVLDFANQDDAVSLPRSQYAAAVSTADILDPATPFDQLDAPLRGMQTRMVYIDPSNNMHNLAGPHCGLEGARIISQVFGDQAWPFSQVLVNSPYIFGAHIMRQNIPERKFNFGLFIGGRPAMNEYQYRMAEDYWWAGQDESNDGWLGCYSRFTGWRWIPVRPDETVRTPQQMDPTAFGNNQSVWDITWLASRPYFTKVARSLTFTAAHGTLAAAPAGLGSGTPGLAAAQYYWGTLPIANAGDLPSYATFYVTSPGQAIVQDNSSGRLVPLPPTVASVGTYMVDTQPGQRTITAANDPKSNLLFDLIRQTTVLEYFLSGLASGSTPLALQFQNRFIYSIPPQSTVSLTVGHSDPNGTVVAVVPQRFKRSR
jgi:hypothetical protein